MSKLMKIEEAIGLIQNGDTLGIGGNVLHRAPMALVREMIRAGKKQLKVIKTAGAMDVDLLCLGGCAQSVDAGFISYESEFSLADHYRKSVQSGQVKGNEHACYTVISALRAGAYGIPFMPVKGLIVSDLIEANDYFTRTVDPFSGEMVTVVRAITPDVSILHVQEADVNGNIMIYGPQFDDLLLAKASKKVIVSAETIVPETKFKMGKDKSLIPHFMVSAVVHIPKGASPCSCPEKYDIDRKSLTNFKAIKEHDEWQKYLTEYEKIDRR